MMVIEVTFVTRWEEQRDALRRLRDLIAANQENQFLTDKGTVSNREFGIKCKWDIKAEKVELKLSLLNGTGLITFNIPRDQHNANLTAMFARNTNGSLLLSRQRIEKEGPRTDDRSQRIFDAYAGPELDYFQSPQTPKSNGRSSSPARKYYVVARLHAATGDALSQLRVILRSKAHLPLDAIQSSVATDSRSPDTPLETISVDANALADQLEQAIQESMHLSPQSRRARLANAPKTPKKIMVVRSNFIRNPDVIAEVLIRAKGECESCGRQAPFERKSDGSPYLEVHHKIQLAVGGYDTVENAVAICPNCHRCEHYGPATWPNVKPA